MTRIDRRALFTSGAAAALLTATGLTAQSAARAGGQLRIAVARDGSLERIARGAVFDNLTEIAADGSLCGELATLWECVDADGRSWEFTLAEGARFHDGQALQPKHVIACLGGNDLPGGTAQVTETGKHRLRIELEEPNPQLPLQLAAPEFAIAGPGTAWNGTGAYRMMRVDTDRHFLGRRIEDHYRAGRAGWADSVEIAVIPDASVRAEALRDGYVDIAIDPEPQDLEERGIAPLRTTQGSLLAADQKIGHETRIAHEGNLSLHRIAERFWFI